MYYRRFLVLCCALFVCMGSLQADAVSDATQRMKERLDQIDVLKLQGLVGENNVGMLAARAELTAAQSALLASENADRRTVYAAVAQRTGQPVEAIARQRALRIAELAASGVWLQDTKGTWYRKE
jgi:uncharacterized protein YdbL (DUF1318 family)